MTLHGYLLISVLMFSLGLFAVIERRSSIAILIGIAAESRKTNQVIRMTGLSEHFQKIFGMVGLTRYAEVFPSEEAALDGF